MSFRLVQKSVTLNDLEGRNSQPPRNFIEFGSFRDGHDMEVFMYVLRSRQCSFLYFVIRIRRRRKKFTFAISSADEFLVSFVCHRVHVHDKLVFLYDYSRTVRPAGLTTVGAAPGNSSGTVLFNSENTILIYL